ncbi:hypothetical protein KIH39_20045 [Telmatocola sphagniphila]|uniref:Uncharacterized protein n=1 Tax=Telmatocola sphagniphila TaxID=1123043 RepID=A0A8E6EU99_9BACT|nr:hypothetical protein [Telmatocola sphagniphila]QVL31120.1 hypothetical protein KIH39_20045 [Telmatocola sphagniphila]
MICRHCKKAKVSRPRGLCWCCFYTPGVKELYPSTSKYARRGEGNFSGKGVHPVAPTSATPGSAEKIAILAERVRNRQELWHPSDARIPGEPNVAAELKLAG